MKRGATDFVSKPWSNERLLATVRTAASLRSSREAAVTERKRAVAISAPAAAAKPLCSASGADCAASIRDRARRPDRGNVSSSAERHGKELVARELHGKSALDNVSSRGPRGVAENLFESELFGHAKALHRRRGDRIGGSRRPTRHLSSTRSATSRSTSSQAADALDSARSLR